VSRVLAYAMYALGSCLFLVVAVSRGSTVVALGSALFLLGTLLLLVPEARRRFLAQRTGRR
jgi:hypothetical protein